MYRYVSNLIFLYSIYFNFLLIRWAVSTVMTRQNLIPSKDGASQMNALIPLWDFCNHQEGKVRTPATISDHSNDL